MTKQLGMVIDLERCIGCEACSVACMKENNPTAGPWIRVETVGSTQKDTPLGTYPDLTMQFMPQLCMHCAQPPCVETCPVEALFKREDGLVLMAGEKCDGCQACIEACPYNAILIGEDNNKVEKCDFCVHRVDQGLEPFCVVCCEGQAMFFGDLNDPFGHISQLIANREVFQLKIEAGTHPSINYCPPRKPRRL